ncbi:MAG: hypothetical protein KH005_07790 [Clostridium sp.]|nr:hypothetical protein [Clostridium sp.]
MARRRHHRRRGRSAADFFGGRRSEEERVDTSIGEVGEESTTSSREELLKELGIINLSLYFLCILGIIKKEIIKKERLR